MRGDQILVELPGAVVIAAFNVAEAHIPGRKRSFGIISTGAPPAADGNVVGSGPRV